MAQPAVLNGEKLLVLLGDGASPETFAAPCMINLTRGLSFAADTNQEDIPDCDDPSLPGWKSTEVVSLGCEITGEGMLDAATVAPWFTWFSGGQSRNVRFKMDIAGSAIFAGAFVCSKLDFSGERKKKATASINLIADGEIIMTEVVPDGFPDNTVAPNVTGIARVGQTLSSTTGTWANSPTGYAYQWYRADTSSAISGATSSTYVPVTGDVGHALECIVTATNGLGSTPATSNVTEAVIASGSAPTNSVAPAITGTAQVGQTLTCSTGTWTGSPTGYTYQWYRADTSSAISGATSNTYVPVTGDVGHTLDCVVTATNAIGSTSQASSTTASVAAAGSAPANSVAPAVTGTAQVGQTLSCTTGTWSNSPTGYTYQWYRADTSTAISGATSNTYVPVTGDVGHTLDCVVTASNGFGSNSANSNTTSTVIASGGGGSPSFDFSIATNSQYIPIVG